MRDPAVALLLPAGDLPAAGDDRPRVRVADVADRALLRAGILRLEDERFADGILAALDVDANRLLQRPGGFELADRVPRADQRCQRTVGSRLVRLLQRAGPGVVALGRDVQVSGGRHVACQRQGDGDEESNELVHD